MTSRVSDVLLGVVFFGSLLGLGAVTIALSDYRFGAPRFDVNLISPDVGYLRPGDPILLYGMPAGKVQTIERLPAPRMAATPDGDQVECRVVVRARLDADLYARVPVDSRISIEDRGLLGGKLIRIEEGKSHQLHERDEPLLAVERKSVLEAAGDVIGENRASLRRTIENIAEMTDSAREGHGMLGALLTDDTASSDMRGAVEDLRGSAADIRAVTASVRAGQGTLGRLISDDALYVTAEGVVTDARGLVADARDVAGKINRGEGTLGRLVNDPSLYERAGHFFEDMSTLSQDIRSGRGIIGALVSDEELAKDFRSIVRQVLGVIEDARESTPVQNVGSFLFGTF
jgi:ABC-type transporter Mla subunit MlaD